MKKALGYFLICSPAVIMFILGVIFRGLLETLAAFGFVALVLALLAAGQLLLED